MALKPDREVLLWDVSKFWSPDGGTATRGGVVVSTGTVPSGSAMDQSVSQVWYNTLRSSGEQPLGLLTADVVNVDLTRQILNPNKSEHQVGDKVPLVVKGWVVTNFIESSTPAVTVGAPAYLSQSGYLTADAGAIYTNAETNLLTTEHPRIGRFLTAADEDGYYKVYIDL